MLWIPEGEFTEARAAFDAEGGLAVRLVFAADDVEDGAKASVLLEGQEIAAEDDAFLQDDRRFDADMAGGDENRAAARFGEFVDDGLQGGGGVLIGRRRIENSIHDRHVFGRKRRRCDLRGGDDGRAQEEQRKNVFHGAPCCDIGVKWIDKWERCITL